MTASTIVDALIETDSVNPDEFLQSFPTTRAGHRDITKVISRLLELKADNGGVWSTNGVVQVFTWGGDELERYNPEWQQDCGWQPVIDFHADVLAVKDRQPATTSSIDTDCYGWQAFIDFDNTDDRSRAVPGVRVSFGTNLIEHGSFEPSPPPPSEVLAVLKAHWEEFKTKFIDQSLWLHESYARKRKEQKELQAMGQEAVDTDEFWRGYLGGLEHGKKIKSAGGLAAYTYTWPEYDHWMDLGRSHRDYDTKDARDAHYEFHRCPNEKWKEFHTGVVYYEGKSIYVKGVGSYNWKVEWNYGSGNNFEPSLFVEIEFWDKDRIWKSHWKKPVLWDYKKDAPNTPRNQTHWDEVDPTFFDAKEFYGAIKDKLVASAKEFIERLSKVAEFTKVRWNVSELFQESTDDDLMGELGRVAANTVYVVAARTFKRYAKKHDEEYAWQKALEACGAPVFGAQTGSETLMRDGYTYYKHGDEAADIIDDIKSILMVQCEMPPETASQFAQFWKNYYDDARRRKAYGDPVNESEDDEELLGQMGEIASSGVYQTVLPLFLGAFRGTDEGPEQDEVAWRMVLIKIGLGDHAVHDRARYLSDGGYELLRGDTDFDHAWSYSLTGLVDDRKIAVNDETYLAVKRLWSLRYQDEDAFHRYLGKVHEGMKPTWGEDGKKESDEGFQQIGGDFGSPWDYGGTWYNAKTDQLIHFPGIDGEHKELEASDQVVDKAVTAKDYKTIADTLNLGETDKWENVEDEIRLNYAIKMERQRKFEYYVTSSEKDEWIERDYARHIVEIKEECQLSDEDWAALPPVHKLSQIADRIGWREFDHYPSKISRGELSSLLGVDL